MEIKNLFKPVNENTNKLYFENNDSVENTLKPLFRAKKELIQNNNNQNVVLNNENKKKLFNDIENVNRDTNRLINTLPSKIKNQIKSDINTQSLETENKKISLQYLYKYFINTNIFRVINGSLYIYNSQYGYLKYIPRNQEEVEINKFISIEDRINIYPSTISNLIKKIKSEPKLQIAYNELNSHKHLINCKNGVVDIRSGDLLPHSFEYKFNYVINANYNYNAINNMYYFRNFLETSLEGDPSKIRLLFEIVGYLCSAYTNAKKAFIFIGKPHSGKSMLSRLIAYLVGEDNVCNIQLHNLGDRFSIAQYSTNKLNIGAEISSTNIKNIEVFKAIVGNDYLQGEYKGRDSFSFKSEIKLLFCGNQMPNIEDSEISTSFIDRLIFLVFNKTTPKEKMNYNLEENLKLEIDGIFTASIIELNRLVNRNFIFTEPKDSIEFGIHYHNKQNHIEEFILDKCIISKNEKIHTKDLYSEYMIFCRENCISHYDEFKFGDYLDAKDFIQRSRFRINGKNLRGFIGIGLKNKI